MCSVLLIIVGVSRTLLSVSHTQFLNDVVNVPQKDFEGSFCNSRWSCALTDTETDVINHLEGNYTIGHLKDLIIPKNIIEQNHS